MDTPLLRALEDLRKHGAITLPSAREVELAKDGMEWRGRKRGGDHWALVKNKALSYNATF